MEAASPVQFQAVPGGGRNASARGIILPDSPAPCQQPASESEWGPRHSGRGRWGAARPRPPEVMKHPGSCSLPLTVALRSARFAFGGAALEGGCHSNLPLEAAVWGGGLGFMTAQKAALNRGLLPGLLIQGCCILQLHEEQLPFFLLTPVT